MFVGAVWAGLTSDDSAELMWTDGSPVNYTNWADDYLHDYLNLITSLGVSGKCTTVSKIRLPTFARKRRKSDAALRLLKDKLVSNTFQDSELCTYQICNWVDSVVL